MHRWTVPATAIIVMVMVLAGCSGSDTLPTSPTVANELTTEADKDIGKNSEVLWGYYDVYFDVEAGTIEAVYNRTLMFEANVVMFINSNPTKMSFDINEVISTVEYVDVDIDVILSHPFPGMDQYNGYDVRGVFIGNASRTMDYNSDLEYAVIDEDQYMLPDPDDYDGGDPDGYTRWYNPQEFYNPGLFGYTKGHASTSSYTGNATLNPYKLFADGLSSHAEAFVFTATKSGPGNNVFSAGYTNRRNYYIRFPSPEPSVRFNYAIVASWYSDQPDDHPCNAPEVVGMEADTFASTLYWLNSTTYGGKLAIDFSLAGYGEQPSRILIESPCLDYVHEFEPGEIVSFGEENFSTYNVEIDADILTSNDNVDVWLIMEYDGHDYSNEHGILNDAWKDRLAAFYRTNARVLDYIPAWIEVIDPNGGEEFIPGTDTVILWDSYEVFGEVTIEYSKDNFVYDINVIAENYPNVGNFPWVGIPFDPSNHVKVRVKTSNPPVISDTSDGYFTILEPTIEVTSPNGGEVWEPGTDEAITWDSQHVLGNVMIEYSSDNFVSDSKILATDIEDTGSFTWYDIPCEHTESGAIRITSMDWPQVSDESDDTFSILSPGTAVTWGTGFRDEGWVIATDDQGNYYVNGLSQVSFAVSNVFLAKYGPCDTEEWIITWGPGGHEYGNGIVVDEDYNVYVLGGFSGTVDFDPGPGYEFHTATGGIDIFMSKFDSSGNHLFTRVWGGSGTDGGYGIALDSSGNIYVLGDFHYTVDFDPGTGFEYHTSNGMWDVYLSKFDSSGFHVWTMTWGGSGNDYGYGLDLDSSDNIYVTGNFYGTVDLDPSGTENNRTALGYNDIYLTKFDSIGEVQWIRNWGGTGLDSAHRIVTSSDDYLYLTGYFSDTVDFKPGVGVENRTSNGGADIFACKFDTAGTYKWAVTWGDFYDDIGYGIEVDDSGNAYATGRFQGMPDFDTGSGTDYRTSNGVSDAYMSKFNSSGDFQYVRTWGGYDADCGYGIAVDEIGLQYVTGYFTGLVDFAPTESPCNNDPYLINSVGNKDVFVSKFLPGGCW